MLENVTLAACGATQWSQPESSPQSAVAPVSGAAIDVIVTALEDRTIDTRPIPAVLVPPHAASSDMDRRTNPSATASLRILMIELPSRGAQCSAPRGVSPRRP